MDENNEITAIKRVETKGCGSRPSYDLLSNLPPPLHEIKCPFIVYEYYASYLLYEKKECLLYKKEYCIHYVKKERILPPPLG